MVETSRSYTASRVMTASPLQLVSIVLEGLESAVKEARKSLAQKKYPEFESEVMRAQKIVEELFEALDFRQEISKDLAAVYYFCKNKLMLAPINRKEQELIDVLTAIEPIKEGFETASKQETKSEQPMKGIVAGMTYGKGTLGEYINTGNKEGYKA